MDEKFEKDKKSTISHTIFLKLVYHVLESHILSGHLFILIMFEMLFLSTSSNFYFPRITTISYLFNKNTSILSFLVTIGFLIRSFSIISTMIIVFYYEKYYNYVGFNRW